MGNSFRRNSGSNEQRDIGAAPSIFKASSNTKSFKVDLSKLAPKRHSLEEEIGEECPICFINYQALNHVICCKQAICTECYISLKIADSACVCPFCNIPNFNVEYKSSEGLSGTICISNVNSLVGKDMSLHTNGQKSSEIKSTKPVFTPTSSRQDRLTLEGIQSQCTLPITALNDRHNTFIT